SAKTQDLDEKWYVVDAAGQTVGRVASDIAYVLRGKHMPNFTPHINMRTFVVVVNADQVVFSGDKLRQKRYYWHTGYPGGIRSLTAEQMLEKKPEEVLRRAVWGMVPKNRLGRATMTRLKILTGPDHPHAAQKPEPLPQRMAAVGV